MGAEVLDRPERQTTEGTFVWSQGDAPLGYSNWDAGQPNDFGTQDCVVLQHIDSEWGDESCGNSSDFGYVCEETAPPPPPPPPPTADTGCWTHPALEANAPWPMRGLCPLRRGAGKFVGSQVNTVNWTFPTGGDLRTGVAISADNTIYFGSDDNKLYALYPNGTQRWAYPTGGDVRSSPLLTSTGAVIFGSDDDWIYSLNAATGALNWKYNTTLDVKSSPAVAADGTIYIGSDTNKLYALSPTNGAVLWFYTTANDIHSSPAVLPDGTIVFGSDDDYVYALKPDLGLTEAQRLKWKTNVGADINAIPAIGPAPDNFIYVRTQGGKVKKLNPTTGVVTATFNGPTDLDTDSSPAIGLDGDVYVGLAHDVYALRGSDLTQKWVRNTGGDVKSSPAIGADGTVYIGSDDKKLYALNPTDGSITWYLLASGTGDWWRGTPAIAKNGAVVVGNENNKLYSIGSFACSPGHPCDNGMGPCTGDSGCGAGLVCGYGIAERYGLPAEFGVCWDPTDCATRMPTACGAPRSRCGDCCVPDCGAAGTSDSCGRTCQTCVAGADTDRDSILDCSEQNDGDPWTNPVVFNGVDAEQGNACHAAPVCSLIDSLSEINGCFSPIEAQRLSAGWNFSTTDKNICDAGFGFEPDWTQCHEDFAFKYEASLRLTQSGIHCFTAEGSTADQCGSFFIAGAAASTGGTVCMLLSDSVYGLIAFYETTGNGPNTFRLKHCFGGFSVCTPTDPIAPEDLLPPGEDPACSPNCAIDTCGNAIVDAAEPCDTALTPYCSADCASESVPTICNSDGDCAEPWSCGLDNGQVLGQDPALAYCWPEDPCDSAPQDACGHVDSACGECVCVPDCGSKACGEDAGDGCGGLCRFFCGPREAGCHLDSDCPADHFCEIGAGPRFGMPSGTNVCVPISCQDYIGSRMDCGSTTDPCGICPTNPNSELPHTLCSPGCGSDEYCSDASVCRPKEAMGVLPDHVAVAPNDPTAEVGTLPGAFSVTDHGAAHYSIPIEVPPGRMGMQPNLSLTYDSTARDGFAGLGWSLTGLPAISRCAKIYAIDHVAAGVNATDEDAFCLNGQRLFVTNGGQYGADGTEYRTELDTFTKVVSFGPTIAADGSYQGPAYFKAWTRDGRSMTLGSAESARRRSVKSIDHPTPTSESPILAWYADRFEDHLGNAMTVKYDSWKETYPITYYALTLGERTDDEENRPRAIYYTSAPGQDASRRVLFYYDDDHKDMMPRRYLAGAAQRTSSVLSRVETYVEDELVRTYRFFTHRSGTSWLMDRVAACVPSNVGERCLPGINFTYDESGASLASAVGFDKVGSLEAGNPSASAWSASPSGQDRERILGAWAVALDFDGDGDDDLLQRTPTRGTNPRYRWTLRLSKGAVDANGGFLEAPVEPVVTYFAGGPGSLWYALNSCSTLVPLDVNADGRDDLYGECGGPRYVFVSSPFLNDLNGLDQRTGPGFRAFLLDEPPLQDVQPKTYSSMLDLDHDGLLDYVVLYTDDDALDAPFHIGWRRGSANPNFPFAALAELGETHQFRLGDHDADGRTDLLVNGPDGGAVAHVTASGALEYVSSFSFDYPEWDVPKLPFFWLDANGDGLNDRIRFWTVDASGGSSGHDTVYPLTLELTTGSPDGYKANRELGLHSTDIYSAGNLLSAEGTALNTAHRLAAFALDPDNDGRASLFVAPGFIGGSAWLEHTPLNNDGGTWSTSPSSIEYVDRGLNERQWQDWQAPIVLDVDGDGVKDLVTRNGDEQDPYFQVRFAQSRTRHRLVGITDGLGAHTAIEYDVASGGSGNSAYLPGLPCDWPQRCLNRAPHPVVAAQTLSGAGGPYLDPGSPTPKDLRHRFEYRYEDGRVDLRGRGFLGYVARTVTELVPGANGPSWAEVGNTRYEYDLDHDDEILRMYTRAGYPTKTTVTVVAEGSTLTGGASTIHKRVVTDDWRVKTSGANRPFIALESETTEMYENGVLVDEEDYFIEHYDGFGNITDTFRVWADDANLHTHFEYEDSFENDWIVSLPTLSRVTGSPRQNAPIEDLKTLQVEIAYDGRALPETVTRVGGVGAAIEPQLVATLGFDSFGNATSTTLAGAAGYSGGSAPPDRSMFITFDSEGYFPTLLENGVHLALNVPDPHALATRVKYDARFGLEKYRKNPDGKWEGREFDGFGRLHWLRDTSERTARADYSAGTLAGGPLEVSVHGIARPTVVTEYNAFAEPIARRVYRQLGETPALEEFAYDDRWQLVTRGVPHLCENPSLPQACDAQSPGAFQYAYDRLGRIVSETYPWQSADGTPQSGTLSYSYASVAHADGNPTLTNWLAVGHASRVVVVDDAEANRSVAALGSRARVNAQINALGEIVEYTYGAFDHVRSTLFQGLTTVTDSDEYGRLTHTLDLDRGAYDYAYNGFGDVSLVVRNRTAASEQVTTYEYDGLGRQRRSDTPNGTYEWTWDGDGTNTAEVGRLIAEDAPVQLGNSRTEYTHDGPGGAVSEIRKRVRGVWFNTSIEYNGVSALPEVVTYPRPNSDAFAVHYTYDESGQVTLIHQTSDDALLWQLEELDAFGGVAEAKTGNGVTLTQEREARTGQMHRISAEHQQHGVLSEEQFAYDSRGLMVARDTTVGGVTAQRQYFSDELGRLRYQALLPSLLFEYDYDEHGNLTKNPFEGTQIYGGPDGGPRSVTSTTSGRSFEYDEHGNQVVRKGPNGPDDRQEITYSGFDLPLSVREGPESGDPTRVTHFEYDANNGRTVREEEGGDITTYLGEFYREDSTSAGTQRVVALDLPDGRVLHVDIDQTNATDRFEYDQRDSQGSVVGVINGEGTMVEPRAYSPFGVAETLSGRVTAGYTGHEHDVKQGLINMRGRMYDPMLGRFLTPDPILGLGTSQGLNPYSYVFNSPLNFTDPSGFEPPCNSDPEEMCVIGKREPNAPQPPASENSRGFNPLGGVTAGDTSLDNGSPRLPPPPLPAGPGGVPGPTVADDDGGALEALPLCVEGCMPARPPEPPALNPVVQLSIGVAVGAARTEELIKRELISQLVAMGLMKLAFWGFGAVISEGAAEIPSAAELLMPGGVKIGQAGGSASIRVLQGGEEAAQTLFQQLAAGGTEYTGTYAGRAVMLPGGGFVGIRTVATGTGARAVPMATIDVNIPGIAIRELKFL